MPGVVKVHQRCTCPVMIVSIFIFQAQKHKMSSDGGVGAPVHFVTVHPYVIEVFTVARANTVTFSSSRDVVIRSLQTG